MIKAICASNKNVVGMRWKKQRKKEMGLIPLILCGADVNQIHHLRCILLCLWSFLDSELIWPSMR